MKAFLLSILLLVAISPFAVASFEETCKNTRSNDKAYDFCVSSLQLITASQTGIDAPDFSEVFDKLKDLINSTVLPQPIKHTLDVCLDDSAIGAQKLGDAISEVGKLNIVGALSEFAAAASAPAKCVTAILTLH